MANEADDEPFGKNEHDKHHPEHSGKHGHYCCDFDGLYICEDCDAFECCTCFDAEQFQ